MANYRCIVLDHDDTVVRSSETVNHPAMLDALKTMRPGMTISYRDFMVKCYEWLDFPNMCKHEFGFTEEESAEEYEMWKVYVRTHIPPPYEGMKELLERFRAEGGLICVSSHSSEENIARDYQLHFGFQPDHIYGWELKEQRKPHPYTLEHIMKTYGFKPEEILMVDDMRTGFEMAAACGVPFACAGWSHADEAISIPMRKNCQYYMASVQELEAFLFDRKTT